MERMESMENRSSAEASKIIEHLAKSFPKTFSTDPSRVQPLAVGIKKMLFKRSRQSPQRVALALRHYTGSVGYLRTIIEGAIRVDLEGAAAGTVTMHQVEHAQRCLAKLAENRSRRFETPKTGAFSRAPSTIRHNISTRSSGAQVVAQRQTSLRPLGLADLKRAAMARRAAAEQLSSS